MTSHRESPRKPSSWIYHALLTARVAAVSFSPTGRAWAAATTEGIIIYSLDETLFFDPFDLDIEITPDNIMTVLQNKQYLKALVVGITVYYSQISDELPLE